MSRQARLIIVVAAMALVAVVALGVMAERYSRIVAGQGSPEEVQARAADRQVERFVMVRTALRSTLDDSGLEQAGDDACGLGARHAWDPAGRSVVRPTQGRCSAAASSSRLPSAISTIAIAQLTMGEIGTGGAATNSQSPNALPKPPCELKEIRSWPGVSLKDKNQVDSSTMMGIS